MSSAVPGGSLYRCRVCHLHFRYPRLAQTALDALYRDGNPGHWRYKGGMRRDWILAERWVRARLVAGRVLDFGCWDGHFLANLSDRFEKLGIEISEEAGARARDAGVRIVATNMYEPGRQLQDSCDAVTAFDVIEHVEDPKTFLGHLIEFARPGRSHRDRKYRCMDMEASEKPILVLLAG